MTLFGPTVVAALLCASSAVSATELSQSDVVSSSSSQAANAQRIEALESALRRAPVLERFVLPLTIRMIDTLEHPTDSDFPLQVEQRRAAVAKLRALAQGADTSIGRLLQLTYRAYLLELETSRTIDAYQGSVVIDNTPYEADMVRLGRVSLLARIDDGAVIAAWSHDQHQFVKLLDESQRSSGRISRVRAVGKLLASLGDVDYREAFEHAWRIGRLERTPGLIIAPISAPKSAAPVSQLAPQAIERLAPPSSAAVGSRIHDLTTEYHEKYPHLIEAFKAARVAAEELRSHLLRSLTEIQFPGRVAFLDELLGTPIEALSIEQLERLWIELQREVTESGKVVQFQAPVHDISTSMVRVGVFVLVADGQFLMFDRESGQIKPFEQQPRRRYLKTLESLTDDPEALFRPVAIDPSGGLLLGGQ